MSSIYFFFLVFLFPENFVETPLYHLQNGIFCYCCGNCHMYTLYLLGDKIQDFLIFSFTCSRECPIYECAIVIFHGRVFRFLTEGNRNKQESWQKHIVENWIDITPDVINREWKTKFHETPHIYDPILASKLDSGVIIKIFGIFF